MDRYELRRLDYGLTDDHRDLQDAYRKFFQAHCTIETVRSAEGLGFDADLWNRLCNLGGSSMALPESAGGDGATLVDLCLVAEEVGRCLAPVPWIDHVCAARLLSRLEASTDLVAAADILSGSAILGFDAKLRPAPGPRLVGSGAIADYVLMRDNDDVVALRFTAKPPKIDNLGRLPMSLIDPGTADERIVLASGESAIREFQVAVDEWRLLMAAALVGLLDQALWTAVDFAKSRFTLGVPIGTLQAISHPLANIAIAVESGRHLARRAAWFMDNDPEARTDLASSAYVFMSEEAAKGATMAVHVQGGLGVSDEAQATAYLVRARGWPLAGGDPGAAAVDVGRRIAARAFATEGS